MILDKEQFIFIVTVLCLLLAGIIGLILFWVFSGICCSTPYSRRRYPRDPNKYKYGDDCDEVEIPIRYFGTLRVGSNLVPDDVGGLPSTHIWEQLISDPNILLYEAEIDHGKAFRRCRPMYLCFLNPVVCVFALKSFFSQFICDEICCWLRKEYSTRTFIRIYSNRIEYNEPSVRFPFACLGCGSWSSDKVKVNLFDRGAFGFTVVKAGIFSHLCCYWPVYGGVVARHRCQCNGPAWNRMFTDCTGWWCDEWLCQMFFCTYRYNGLTNADEFQFAASIALQAYFEGRKITPDQMNTCINYWYDNIAERSDPIGRKRPVCCEPYYVPSCDCTRIYNFVHPYRAIPFGNDNKNNNDDDVDDYNNEKFSSKKNNTNSNNKEEGTDGRQTDALRDVYNTYEVERVRQCKDYEHYRGPVENSTICRGFGCRRFCGRKGVFFCTEGCDTCFSDSLSCCNPNRRKAGDPAPPITQNHDIDDEWDASSILFHVLGPPPSNVVIKRWRYDPEKNENYLDIYPPPPPSLSSKSPQ